jgi:hypothetical protein
MVNEDHLTPVLQTTMKKEARMNPTRKETEEVTSDERLATRGGPEDRM